MFVAIVQYLYKAWRNCKMAYNDAKERHKSDSLRALSTVNEESKYVYTTVRKTVLNY